MAFAACRLNGCVILSLWLGKWFLGQDYNERKEGNSAQVDINEIKNYW